MAVRALLHYALEIPDLSVGERFYRNFGLAGKSTRDEAVHLCPTRLSRESILLYPGPKKRLHHLAFGAPRDEYAQVQEAIQRAGVPEVDPPAGGLDGGMWIRDPDGNLLNIRDEGPLTPPADPPITLNSPGHPTRQAVRGCPEADLRAQPRRLGHVLLFTPDVDRQLAFYTQVLGLKLSDRCQRIIAFLRCSSDHHNVAFLSSKGPGFHHGSFEVGGVDEIAMGAQRMRESGWEPGWGLGRHVIGSNYFYYIRDPWGSFAEYFFDLDYIPESFAWEPRDFPEHDALYRWGPEPPPDFGENTVESISLIRPQTEARLLQRVDGNNLYTLFDRHFDIFLAPPSCRQLTDQLREVLSLDGHIILGCLPGEEHTESALVGPEVLHSIRKLCVDHAVCPFPRAVDC